MAHLTPKQLRVVDIIRQFRTKWGFGPTLEEIAAPLRVTKATAQCHIRTLSAKNILRRASYAHRSIEINEDALADDPGTARNSSGRSAPCSESSCSM